MTTKRANKSSLVRQGRRSVRLSLFERKHLHSPGASVSQENRHGPAAVGQGPSCRAQTWRSVEQEEGAYCDRIDGDDCDCGEDLIGKRDRALLYFAFASRGRRQSETAHATLSKLSPIEGGYLYHLDVGKTLQDGVKAGGSPDKPLLGPPWEQ